ncbi:MAG TPA: CBS domain-containing protein [Gemmatimonadaceae bacterium]|nr:CBS domain-containing protein [Gemmatimonadaceae bacterium]
MTLADLVSHRHAVVPLSASTTIEAALQLVDRLVDAGAVEDPDKLRGRVAEARGEDVVAMGDRAFVMHYRTDAVADLVVAVGTSPQPLHRDLTDGETPGARIVLLIVAPPRLAARYLQVLSAFARLLSNLEVVAAVTAAPNAEALAALPALRQVQLPEQLSVRDVMTERPRTTTADTPLRDAAAIIAGGGFGALPVVDDTGVLVGMLSERELVRYLMQNQLQSGAGVRTPVEPGKQRRLVRDVMTRQVLCVSPDQPLAEVASIMVNKDLDAVPVVREGRVAGYLSRGDIIRKLIGS